MLRKERELYLRDLRGEVPPKPGHVPRIVRWLVAGPRYLGWVSIRLELNESLRRMGGHVGYAIRPSERRKGYGMLAMQLAMPVVRHLGITRALVTCDETNVASRKIIERNGGALENAVEFEGTTRLRFWV
ncbi:MAG: hypothetical protein AMXMBFR34_09390 [Myxococcaceae bacterium]